MRFLSLVRIDESRGFRPSEQLMADMGRLMQEMTAEGHLIQTHVLRPTAEGKRVRLQRGRLGTTDGPFTESKEVVGGYALLEAASMEEALALTERFLKVHGDEVDVECEVRAVDEECGPSR